MIPEVLPIPNNMAEYNSYGGVQSKWSICYRMERVQKENRTTSTRKLGLDKK